MPAAGSPGIRPAADLFVGQGNGLAPWSDVSFFSYNTGNVTTGPGFSIPQPSYSEPPAIRFDPPKADQAEHPRPRLVQGEAHAGSGGEPFNLQARVFPNHTDNIGLSSEASSAVSARLLAAEEGRLSAASPAVSARLLAAEEGRLSGQADDIQELGSNSVHGTIRPPHPYQVPRPVSRQDPSIHPPQQHPFIEWLPGPGVPPWKMPGVPYEYGTGFPGGWYNHPATTYPPAYPPSNHLAYHGPYAEGALRVPSTMQNHSTGHPNYHSQGAIAHGQEFYFSGTAYRGYKEHPHSHRATSHARTNTLPNVAAGNPAPPSRPDDIPMSESTDK